MGTRTTASRRPDVHRRLPTVVADEAGASALDSRSRARTDVAAGVYSRRSVHDAGEKQFLFEVRRDDALRGLVAFSGGKRDRGERISDCLVREFT